MSRLRAFCGYAWAIIALPIILATFIGNNFLAEQLVSGTGIKISPWITGGEVIQTIDHQQYRTLIHRPVFDGLVWKRRQGFIQINWQAGASGLPELLDETIDYDHNGSTDFQIHLNTRTNQAELIAPKSYVIGIGPIFKLKNERVVRVVIRAKN